MKELMTVSLPTSALNMDLAVQIPAFMELHNEYPWNDDEDSAVQLPKFDSAEYDEYGFFDDDDDEPAPVKKRGERRRRTSNARKAYHAVCQFAGWRKSRFSKQTKVDRCTYDIVCKQTAVAKELRSQDLANRQYLGAVNSSEFMEEYVIPEVEVEEDFTTEDDFWDDDDCYYDDHATFEEWDVALKRYNLCSLPMEKILRIAEIKGISTSEVREAYEQVFAKLMDVLSVDESDAISV